MTTWLVPQWPAAANVRACVTTREGGVSLPPYDCFNLGDHVGDDPAAVAQNRLRLSEQLGCQPTWLQQVHGVAVVDADPQRVLTADAVVSRTPGIAACIMTADCLPVLFSDRAGTCVAAAHAGWRGLAAGVLEETVAAMGIEPGQLLAWMGPAIGPHVFEVGDEVRQAFVEQHVEAAAAFRASANHGRHLADIYALARLRLSACGVRQVSGGGFCTVSDPRFYSYRRDQGHTGRFASLVWLQQPAG